MRAESGYTLAELLLALALVTLALLGTLAMSGTVQRQQHKLERHEQALILAEQQLGQLAQTPFAAIQAQSPPVLFSVVLPSGQQQDFYVSWQLSHQDSARKDVKLTVRWGAQRLALTCSVSAIFLPQGS